MSLGSLIFSSDDKIVRILRRVLSDLDIRVEHSDDLDSAIRKLTRERFEAVIVDCADPQVAAQVIRSVRSAPCNQRAIAVAIADGQIALKSVFEQGAHFVLYKPISSERAKSSFRAARALMKRERRRNLRVPVEIPVTLVFDDGAGHQKTVTSDISEGGMSLQLKRLPKGRRSLSVDFTLPGSDSSTSIRAEIAWETSGQHVGLRFGELPPDTRKELHAFLNQHAPESEKDDPPVRCTLTDLSPGGCYLESSSPFPPRTKVVLCLRAGQLELQAEGVVRVMHPEAGMGIEFQLKSREQRKHVARFVHSLKENRAVLPELTVEPEGMEESGQAVTLDPDGDDPLVDLFYRECDLSPEEFQEELKRQRREGSEPNTATISI